MSTATDSFRRAARQVKSWVGGRVVILLYHRIANREPGSLSDPHRISVSPDEFKNQIEIARTMGRMMRLDELADALENRRLPKRGIVVTFDDGYADNLYTARPILEALNVPATVFMTSGEIGRRREFWWDALAQLLVEAGTLPSVMQLRLGDRNFAWSLSSCARWSDVDAAEYSQWEFESGALPTARHRAYRDIYRLLWNLDDAARAPILDDLFSQAGRSPRVRGAHRALDDGEIVRLGEGKLIEIGAHTVTHPNLAAQSLEIQREEIEGSKRRLGTLTGRPVESFAYPYGLHTQETVRLVREAGFRRACVCMGHSVRKSSELLRLTRTDPGSGSSETFEGKLKEAFSA